MSVCALIRRVWGLGIRLRIEGDQLHYAAPAGVITAELIEELREGKTEILSLLADPSRATRAIWEDALEEISSAWISMAALLTEEEKNSLWLKEDIDTELHTALQAAIVEGDLDRTIDVVERWRGAWWGCLNGSPRVGNSASPASPASPTLGEVALVPEGAHKDLANSPSSLVPREAFTPWLKRNEPVLYELWPQAPVGAGWFDWRLYLGGVASGPLWQAWQKWYSANVSCAVASEEAPRRDGRSKRRRS